MSIPLAREYSREYSNHMSNAITADTITYAYVRDHVSVPGSWRGPRDAAIAAAVDHLGAVSHSGAWAYLAEETGTWWTVDESDMAEYGAAVLSGHAQDAYSLWCAGASGEEIVDPTEVRS